MLYRTQYNPYCYGLIYRPFIVECFKVEWIQRGKIQECLRKAAMVSARKNISVQDDATFFCQRCGEFACEANHIRRLRDTYHVVIDTSFKERIEIKPRKVKKVKKVDDIVMANKVNTLFFAVACM